MAYQPDVFGESIIVERHFNKAGTSQFKIKNANDRLVSSKRGDLEDILDYLALQLDNPMNVLTQDMARQFLNSSSPNQKYMFFIRGTQLEQLDRDYRVMEDYLDSTESKLHNREDDVNVLGKRAKEAEEKKRLIDKSRSLRDRIMTYRWMHAWAQVEEEEASLKRSENAVEQANERLQQVTTQADEQSTVFDQHNEALERAVAAKVALETDREPAIQRHGEIKEQFDKYKQELLDNTTTRRLIQQDLKNAKQEVARTQAAIEAEQARIRDANGPAQARKLQELEEAKAYAEERRRLVEQGGDKTQLEREQDAKGREVDASNSAVAESRAAVGRANTVLQDLKRDQGLRNNAFHNKLPALERAIRGETRFREQPVGPMGKHVQLLKPEWGSIIESVCGGNLDAWVVTSRHDQSILSDLQRKVGW